MSERTSIFGTHPVLIMRRNIVWAGDLNYRVDLENETVRVCAEVDDFDPLLRADQVRYSLSSSFLSTSAHLNHLAQASDEVPPGVRWL